MAPDDNGLKQGMVPGLELHSVSKINDSIPKSEATFSGVERQTGAELQEELNSKTRNEHRPPFDYSSSSDDDEESLDQAHQWSMISVSPRAGAGNFSSEIFSSSAIKPPLSQTMGRPHPSYDPSRIPSSIFSQGPTTPMEWSTASNESLFSIHMENNSFSRELYVMQGDTKHDDWFYNTNNNISEVANTREELKKTQAEEKLREFETEKPPAADGAHAARLSVDSSNLSDGRRLSSAESGRHSLSALQNSNESVHSSGSFAFPILVQASRIGSLKVTSPKTKEEAALPQPQNQTTEATTPEPLQANSSSCFSCIMCWPRCCF